MSQENNMEYTYEEPVNGMEEPGKKNKKKPAKKNKSRKKDNRLAIAMVAVLSAFVIFVVLLVIQDRILNQEDTQPVVVAVMEVPKGTLLTQENMATYFKVENRDIDEIPEGITFANGFPLVDKVTDRVIYPKEIVTEGCFLEEGLYDGIVDPVEIAIEVSQIGQAVAGTLRIGDKIDIKAVIKVPGSTVDTETKVSNVDEIPVVGLDNEGNPANSNQKKEDVIVDMKGNAIADASYGMTYGVTGNYATQTLAENVRVVGVYTSGGENAEQVKASGEVMVATVINVVIPRSLQDRIFLAMAEGTIRLSKVQEVEVVEIPAE